MPRHPRESHKIDIEYLPERILQDPSHKRFPRELSHKHLQYRSRIFTQGPLRGFHQDLQKTFSTRPWPRSSCKDLYEHSMKLWPDGPIDLFARNIENQQKWAPRHNESDLTRTKWWDGGGSTYQNFTNPARITKNESLKCETECFTSICALFLLISTKFCACQKNEPETSEALHLPR